MTDLHKAATQHGQLDPRAALEQARTMMRYVDSFNNQKFSPALDSVDRQNLAVALDNLQETAAMLLNMAERVPLREALAKPAVPEWQPIETAPKDGTNLLLCSPAGRMAEGSFHSRYGVWSWPYVVVEPTHWMPLPAAPKPKEQTT